MENGSGDSGPGSGRRGDWTTTGRDGGEPVGGSTDTARITAPEAFSLLANETRMAILQRLWEHRGDTVGFSALHAAVDVDRGNFNYHLGELAGHFVAVTDDGYELREAGKQVVRALLAGVITTDPTVEPTDLGLPCPFCGGSIEVSYADEWITVRCTDCRGVMGGDVPPGTFMHHPFPPAGLRDRDGIELLEAARVHYETDVVSMVQGVCPECNGRVDDRLHVCDRYETGSDGLCVECDSVPGIWVAHECGNCSYTRWCTLWLPTLFHPAVISFVYDRQPFESLLELRRLFWTDPDALSGIDQTVVSETPLRIRVTVPFESDEITVTVDGSLRTVAVE